MVAVAFSPEPLVVPVPTRRARVVGWFAPLRRVLEQSRLHGSWIIAWSIVGWVGTAAAPFLHDQPFLLMLLAPRAVFVAMAAGSVNIVWFVLMGTLRLGVTDASYFIIGRRLPRALASAPRRTPRTRLGRSVRRLGSVSHRLCSWMAARPGLAAVALFVRPNGRYLALAGGYRVSAVLAGLSATIGTACFLAAVHVGLATII